jgi:putative transposase
VLTVQQENQRIFLKEQFIVILSRLKRLVSTHVKVLCARCVHWTKPLSSSLPLGTLADLGRSKSELIAENALLRQQLIVLKRQVKRPVCTKADRILLVLLARVVRAWKQVLVIVQPETLLRWHREAFRLYWKHKSKAHAHKPNVATETIALIKEMAKKNRLWGAERIRGELLKLGIHVCKRTIQKYIKRVRSPQPKGQKWATFLCNHAAQIWACDFIQVTDLFFRPLFAFVIIELKSRRVIQVGVTRSPTDPRVAQHLREATPYGQAPTYLIRDNDSKFGHCFVLVAVTSAIEILITPDHSPRANAVCERFLRSVWQQCLDHLLILHQKQLQRVRNRVCGVLQPGPTKSRDPTVDSRIVWIILFLSVQRNRGDCNSDLGRAALGLQMGGLKR